MMVALAVREAAPRYRVERSLPSPDRTSNEQPATSNLAASADHTSDERQATSDEIRSLSEATLVKLWAGQRFPAAALVTRRGVAVRVLHPGRRGRGAGPDFRDAIIATPSGAVVRGDVELHVRASDFCLHGHDRDPNYNGLVLHVVFGHGQEEETRLASGRSVPVVSLGAWARQRAAELASWLETPALWREPCVHAVKRLGAAEVLRTLDELGDRRFAEREAALASEIASRGPGEALYRALLAGLAYGSDRGVFAEVAERLPWRTLAERLTLAPPDEAVAAAEALLLDATGSLGDRVVSRPANHPRRRLAGLAQLIVRHHALFGAAAPEGLLALPPPALIAAWSVPASGGALIGRGRAIELLVNAVLPWAAAVATSHCHPHLAAEAHARFATLPRPGAYGVLTFLENNLRVEGAPLDARRQQGLLALYKTECTQGGCGRCVFS